MKNIMDIVGKKPMPSEEVIETLMTIRESRERVLAPGDTMVMLLDSYQYGVIEGKRMEKEKRKQKRCH